MLRPGSRYPQSPQRYKGTNNTFNSDKDVFGVPPGGNSSQHDDASQSKPVCLTAPINNAPPGPRTSESAAEGNIPVRIHVLTCRTLQLTCLKQGNEIDLGLGRSLSVVEFTACMAHVVSFLVDERVRRMKGGVEADAKEVGRQMDVSTVPHLLAPALYFMPPFSVFICFAPLGMGGWVLARSTGVFYENVGTGLKACGRSFAKGDPRQGPSVRPDPLRCVNLIYTGRFWLPHLFLLSGYCHIPRCSHCVFIPFLV